MGFESYLADADPGKKIGVTDTGRFGIRGHSRACSISGRREMRPEETDERRN
jgi:hypothetical protein